MDLRRKAGLVDELHDERGRRPRPTAGQHEHFVEYLHGADQPQHVLELLLEQAAAFAQLAPGDPPALAQAAHAATA